MCWMCSETPSLAQVLYIHNKFLAWKRNELAMMLYNHVNLLVVPWHLFEPGSGHFTYIGTRVSDRVNEVRTHASKKSRHNENL